MNAWWCLLLACAPPEVTPKESGGEPLTSSSQAFTVWDLDACTAENVLVAVDTAYWIEWVEEIGCAEVASVLAGTDGLCYVLSPVCDDAPPLITDDPFFQGGDELLARCTEFVFGDQLCP